jgi:glycosyltransferase involved in cell wall biosynthesis
MRKPTLSVALATYNEDKNLEACLQSIKDIADEIVIVDGTSTDKTVEIAKKFGAKVIETTNKQNFHVNKQMAIDACRKDWILQLDADEKVTPQLAEEIKKVIAYSDETNGYWIPRKNWFLGRYLMKGGVYPDYTLRLYKNGKGRLPQKDVHEQAVVEGQVAYLKEPLDHLADPEFGRYFRRWQRYTSFIAQQYKEQHVSKDPFTASFYIVIKPIYWFLLAYGRHKGFMDGWQGFVFTFFSALRFPVSYIKYLKI